MIIDDTGDTTWLKKSNNINIYTVSYYRLVKSRLLFGTKHFVGGCLDTEVAKHHQANDLIDGVYQLEHVKWANINQ